MVLADYLPILLLLGLAAVFGLASIFVAQHVGPSNPTRAKEAPYESGIVPDRLSRDRFPIKFALVAMLFIIFDVEVVFFYPWAVIFRELGLFGLAEMGAFVGLLFVAYVYVLRMGGLDWEERGVSVRRAVSAEMLRAARRGSTAESMVATGAEAAAAEEAVAFEAPAFEAGEADS